MEGLFGLAAVFIMVAAAAVLVRSVGEWNRNNHAPRLTVAAQIVSRRTSISTQTMGDGAMHTTTTHYVTFEVASGDRMEMRVPGREYGLLTEGGRGQLSFQGTRYLSFERGAGC